MMIYHISRTRVSETRVPHQFCHRSTIKVEIGNYLISKVLELTMLKYLVTFFFFFLLGLLTNKHKQKMCLFNFEGTRARVPCNFFFFFWIIDK